MFRGSPLTATDHRRTRSRKDRASQQAAGGQCCDEVAHRGGVKLQTMYRAKVLGKLETHDRRTAHREAFENLEVDGGF
ncbi:hypothetical protein EYF80_015854 [Liparis tanakae]|uniref:Uncharacterized protein n=1 Tax=Liparis tanakae TaxID=230148 RepID=A0A4Z2I717_9TELE|nr:hypothetical protein EYF80_015854 [Liparis tanakae]